MKPLILVLVCLLFACSEKTKDTKAPEKVAAAKKEEAPKAEAKKAPEKPAAEAKVEEKAAEKAPAEKAPAEKAQTEMKFAVLKYAAKDLPKTVKVLGKVKHGLRWQDKNGENWFVLSASEKSSDHHGTKYLEAQNLYATHVAINGAEVKVLRNIKQIKPKCEFDWSASFEPRAISVLDLDKDGYGEATFAYRTNCTSDVSPGSYKLLVLENGEKNILRGTELLEQKQYRQPGDGTFKSEGFKASKALLDHAKTVWNKTKIAKSVK